ncbi:hypothetical protein EDB81DRAFT_829166 [Dactylonectria macrodidyma]|uniref:Uncharacterized protein n=1 Tax=Dactylonectria macrodidyma TaxID=307937 RepID=A0A9P9D2Y4_9HYPO|nr:hypothetical protein EDB81DRAFT_829166 [Dactylonectria macrodidyma]
MSATFSPRFKLPISLGTAPISVLPSRRLDGTAPQKYGIVEQSRGSIYLLAYIGYHRKIAHMISIPQQPGFSPTSTSSMDPRSQLLARKPPIASLVDQFHARSEAIFTTDTRAHLWDMNAPGRQDDTLDNTALRAKLAHYNNFWESDGKGAGTRTLVPKLVLVTVLGEVVFGKSAPATLQIRRDTLQYLVEVAGFCSTTTQKFLTTLTPYVHSYLQYDDGNDTPAYMTLVFRCPRNSNCIMGSIRVQLSTRNCFVFLSCNEAKDIQSIRSYCATHTDLLKIHPLYLLSFIYEDRYQRWIDWFAKLWREVVEVETVTNTSRPQWKIRQMDAERFKALSRADVLVRERSCDFHTL